MVVVYCVVEGTARKGPGDVSRLAELLQRWKYRIGPAEQTASLHPSLVELLAGPGVPVAVDFGPSADETGVDQAGARTE